MSNVAIEARDHKKIYVGVQAARDAVAGAGGGQVAGLLVGKLAVGLVFAAIGYAPVIWLENQARHGGLQEAY